MRIRKRKVPFPLSSLSPIPLSDPNFNFNGSPLVQLQPTPYSNPSSYPSHHVHSEPSDHHPHQHRITNGWDFLDPSSGVHKDQKIEDHHLLELLENKEENNKRVELESEEAEKCNDIRKGSIFSAETVTINLPESVRRWCEGEKAFPLKKRRRTSLKRSIANDDHQDTKMKTKTKINTNKKCIIITSDHDHDEVDEDDDEDDETKEAQFGSKRKNKKKKGGAIMEGSRCSRVNGRGWRCCQQTLVGYSLCEHHLGKGRLRTMSSFRNRSKETNLEIQENNNINNINKACENDSHEEENKMKLPLIVSSSSSSSSRRRSSKKKKTMKLGMVKARSISSLLGQTSTSAISTTYHRIDNNN